MADLQYVVDIKGVEDLQALANGVEKVTGVLTAAKGSGKALEELRKVLVGIKGSSSVLHELRDAINQLNSASDRLGTGITRSIKGMEKALTSELKTLQTQVNMLGAEMAKGYSRNYEEGLKKGTSEIISTQKAEQDKVTRAAKRDIAGYHQQLAAQIRSDQAALKKDIAGFNAMDALRGKSVVSGNKANEAALKSDLEGFRQMQRLQIVAAANAVRERKALEESATAASLAAQKADLAGFQNMLRLKSAASIAAAAKRASDEASALKANNAALEADLAGYQNMLRLKSAAAITAANTRAASEAAAIKSNDAALQADLAGYQNMLRLKSAAALTATKERSMAEANALKANNAALQADLAGYQNMLRLKSAAALTAAKERQAADALALKANNAALQADLDGFRNMLRLKVNAAQEAAAQIQAANRSQVSSATNNAVGSYTRYNANTGVAGRQIDPIDPKAVPNTNAFSKAMRGLTKDMGDTHSMARGLASGFNLLWLTWGNLAPLFIGAAISNGFMKTAKEGMEVAHSLQTIASLGMDTANTMTQTAHAVSVLSTELIRLGNEGIYGPVQAAEAMQVLALAGLKANEVLAVTGTVLSLATAGTTDIKTAADVLVSITTAFGTGAAGFRQAADIMVRAAADSKASIESIGEAMKTASVVGEQYGASIGDVGTMIALLANLGIQGTAAGTAIRNMFVDMSERTPKVAKIMKQFGLDFRDATTGSMKPLIENVQQLDKVLHSLDAVSGKNLLQQLFSERGGKAVVASLAEYRKAVTDADGTTQKWSATNNALTKQLKAIEEASGDAAIAAAEMSQSTLNSFKAVGATVQTSMFQAFQAMEPQLYILSIRMREAFSDPAVVSGLTTMVKLVADLGVFLADNAKMIGVFLGVWAGGKVFGMIAKSVSGLVLGLMNIRTILVGSIVSIKTWGAAATALGGSVAAAGTAFTVGGGALALWATRLLALGRLIPGVSTVLTILTGAMFVYNRLMDDGTTAANTWSLKSDEVVKKMQAEITELDKINALRMQGLSTLEAEIRLKDESARASAFSEGYAALSTASGKTASAAATYGQAVAAERSGTRATGGAFGAQRQDTPRVAEALAALNKARTEENAIRNRMVEDEKVYNSKKEELRSKAAYDQRMRDQERLEELRKQQKAMTDILGQGSKTFGVGGDDDNPRGANVGVGSATNKLKEIQTTIMNQREYIANLKEEDLAARQLTDAEKVRNSVLAALNTNLTANARAAYQQALAAANVSIGLEKEIALWKQKQEIQKAWVADYGSFMAVQDEMVAETVRIAELQKQETLNRVALNNEINVGQKSLMTEIGLIGQSASAREDALIDLKYEIDLQKELKRIKDSDAYTSDDQRSAASNDAIISNSSQKSLEKATKAAKSLQSYLDPGSMKEFGDSASKAFKKIVNPIQTLAKSLESYVDQMKNLEKSKKAIDDDRTLKDDEKAVQLNNLKAEGMKVQLKGFGDMAAAAAGFFDEESKGYKTLMAVSQAFHTAQMAMTMAQQVQSAILAVLGQAQGDPYSAFVRMAAMIAFVGSLGVALSGGGGGGASSGYQGIAKGGTGTVMGMEGEQSESLANSIEILAANSKIELTYTQKMLSEMTKMREGIQGLAGTASQDFFVRGFAGAAFGDSFLDSGIGFLPGQTVADIIEKGVQGFGFNLIFDKGAQALWKGLDETFTKGVGSILGNVAEVVYSAADALGLNDEALTQRMLSLIPTLGDTSTYQQNGMMGMIGGGLVSFKDMSGKEIQEELEAIFSAVGDQMVAAALPQLKPFQRIGEGMFETLTRLTSGIESANYEMEKLGFTAIKYTDIIRKNGDIGAEIVRQTLMSVEAELAMYRNGSAGTVVSGPTPLTGVAQILDTFTGSQDELLEVYSALMEVRKSIKNVGLDFLALSATMVRGAAGLENLTSGLETYFTEFFSEEEQLAAKTARLTEEFQRINVTMPTSLEAFRKLVESLDLSTESGQYLFGQLMGVTDAFVEVYKTAEEATEAVRTIAEGLKLLTEIEGDFLTPGAVKANAVLRIQDTISKAGYGLTAPEQILGFSRQEFYDMMKNALDVGDMNRFNTLVAIKDDYLSVVDDTVTSLEKQRTEWEQTASTLESTAQSLESVKKSASNLSRELSVALGGADTKEGDLWAIVRGGGSLEDRIAAAEELKSLIEKTGATELQNQKTALANAQKMLDFGKSLKDYVDKLKTGNISALTPSEKMAEAANQYSTTLAKAQSGDQEALAKLQSVSDTYLNLAREYDPSSYGGIFNTVTSQLSALGNSLISQYQNEVSYREAAIAAAETSNGLTAAQLSKMSELKTVVDTIQTQAANEAFKVSQQLTFANGKLAIVESLLVKANDVWSYLPGMGSSVGSIETSLNSANLTWESMPASMVQAFTPLIGIPNRAEEETVSLLNMMIEKFVQLEAAVREGAILGAETTAASAERAAQLQRENQEELARQLASKGVTTIV